jgi:hypothetical protein
MAAALTCTCIELIIVAFECRPQKTDARAARHSSDGESTIFAYKFNCCFSRLMHVTRPCPVFGDR